MKNKRFFWGLAIAMALVSSCWSGPPQKEVNIYSPDMNDTLYLEIVGNNRLNLEFGNPFGTFHSGVKKGMEEEYHNYVQPKKDNWWKQVSEDVLSDYIDCVIVSPLRIYADVPLFGREAGQDLSDLIYVKRTFDYSRFIVVSYPDYDVLCEYRLPDTKLDKIGPVGSVMPFGPVICEFVNPIPDDILEKGITFTAEITVNGSWADMEWADIAGKKASGGDRTLTTTGIMIPLS